MKKLIILIFSIFLFYTIWGNKSSNKDYSEQKEVSELSKVRVIKNKKEENSYKKRINTDKSNQKKIINKMMIHFFKVNKTKIQSILTKGDYNKLNKLINKIDSKKELSNQDYLVYEYLKKRNIIKALKYNNLNLL